MLLLRAGVRADSSLTSSDEMRGTPRAAGGRLPDADALRSERRRTCQSISLGREGRGEQDVPKRQRALPACVGPRTTTTSSSPPEYAHSTTTMIRAVRDVPSKEEAGRQRRTKRRKWRREKKTLGCSTACEGGQGALRPVSRG